MEHITLNEGISRNKRSEKKIIQAAQVAKELHDRYQTSRENARTSRDGYLSGTTYRYPITTTTTRRPLPTLSWKHN